MGATEIGRSGLWLLPTAGCQATRSGGLVRDSASPIDSESTMEASSGGHGNDSVH